MNKLIGRLFAMLCLSTNAMAAGPSVGDYYPVYLKNGACETGKIEVGLQFGQNLTCAKLVTNGVSFLSCTNSVNGPLAIIHTNVNAGTCLTEVHSNQAQSQLAVRCVDPARVRPASDWVYSAQFGSGVNCQTYLP